MARNKATKEPAAGALVFPGYTDGPSVSDISDESSPWFVNKALRKSYLAIASDPIAMRRIERAQDSLGANQAISLRNFAIRWQQAKGVDPEQTTGGIVTVFSTPSGLRRGNRTSVDEMQDEVQRLTGASGATIHRHEWTQGEAWRQNQQQEARKKREAADLRTNTCHHCGDYVPHCGGECSTCLDAMEFYSLQQAAQSERGKRAIEKLRATRG